MTGNPMYWVKRHDRYEGDGRAGPIGKPIANAAE
jgi:hypothetical protein